MQFCFIHAADLHLDTPFEGISLVSPDLARRLRDASLDALDNLVNLAIERDAAFLLLAGDIYDGAERGIRAQFHFRDAMKRLEAKRIRVFLVHGNHDPLDGWSAIRNWPANVMLFPTSRVATEAVERDGQRIANIHGISYATRDVTENLAAGFQRDTAPGLHIGLLHCNVGSAAGHAKYSPCSSEDLARAGMDYWALGHIHTRRLFQAGDAWAAYPGNTQGRSFQPGEQGPKGAMVVTATESGVEECIFHAVDSVRFQEIHHDIAKLDDWGMLYDVLAETAQTLLEEAGGRHIVLRATLTGRGALHRELRDPARVEALLAVLRRSCESERAPLHWAALHDETRPDFERKSIAGRGDFAAELVARTDSLLADPDSLESFAANCWKHQQARLLARYVPDASGDQCAGLLEAAERKALELIFDRLEEEAGQ
jgi:DNA repair protein SbcD/Mre11